MKSVSADKFLYYQRKALRQWGCDIFVELTPLRVLQMLINSALLLVGFIPSLYFVAANIRNFGLVLEAINPMIIAVLSLVKALSIYSKQRVFRKIIDNLRKLWSRALPSDEDILLDELNADQNFAYWFFCLAYATTVAFLSIPILIGIHGHFTTGKDEWEFAILGKYFIDVSTFPAYVLIYLWHIYEFLLGAAGYVGGTTMYIGIVFNICGHFKVIQRRFKTIRFEIADPKHPGRYVLSEDFKNLIEYHVAVNEMANNIREFYSVCICITCILSPSLLCASCIQVLNTVDLSKLLIYVPFIVVCTGDVFLHCIGGHRIMTESSKVLAAIYDNEWYKCTPETRKHIVFCMMRANDYKVIDGGFYIASLQTFSTILKSTYSLVTLMGSFR